MKSFKALFRPKFLIAGALLAVASVFSVNALTNNSVSAALPVDCEDNSIIKCGFQDHGGFKADYQANVTGDLDDIYKNFDFTADEMARFMDTAKWGWTYRDGKVRVEDSRFPNDHRVVITNAWSMGRGNEHKPGREQFSIPGANNPFYKSPVHIGFASSTQRIRTLIMMDENDKYVEFAIMTSCGNPSFGDKPTFECKELKKNQIDDNTYEFWTDVALKNATIKNLKYEFSDGSPAINETDPNKKIKHDFATGKHTVKVTITYIVNGVEQSETLQAKCKLDIEVKEKKPEYKCTELDKVLIDGRKYRFIGKAEFKNSSLTSAKFDFGDGQTAPGVIKATSATTADITAEHTYAENLVGTKKITLDLTFTIGNDTQNKQCVAEVNFKEKPCVPKEGEDANCKILPKETCVPKPGEDEKCVKIPETGAAEILSATLGVSGLGAAGAYYRASRKNLRDLIKR